MLYLFCRTDRDNWAQRGILHNSKLSHIVEKSESVPIRSVGRPAKIVEVEQQAATGQRTTSASGQWCTAAQVEG